MSIDVVGVGYPVVDCLARIPFFPEKDGLVHMDDCSWQGGGMVSTGLIAASVLGASAGMVGVVGDDQYGRFCLYDFERNGVDTSHMVMDHGATTNFAIVLSEKNCRSFLSRDGNRRELQPEELDAQYIAQAKYLLVTEMDAASVAACQIAHENGVKVVIDADIFDQRTVYHLDLIDEFIASQIFYEEMFQEGSICENCRKICGMGPEIAIITLGDKGCAGIFRGEYIQAPSFDSIQVVDTTGAGDVFHGAFIYGLLQNWSGTVIARFANAVAAIKCTRLGGRAGIPNLETVEKHLATGVIEQGFLEKRAEMYREGLVTEAG